MRGIPILLVVIVATAPVGCTPPMTAALLSANIPSFVALGRSTVDVVYSGITGRDCAMVRTYLNESYCRPIEPPPAPQPFCTRALGGIDCWADPQDLNDHPSPIADGPGTLTPAQDANRLRRWPDL